MLKPWRHEQTWQRSSGYDLCCHCGRPVKEPAQYMVEVVLAGEYVRHDTPDLETLRSQNDYLAWFPVGPDCARRLKKDGVIVMETAE